MVTTKKLLNQNASKIKYNRTVTKKRLGVIWSGCESIFNKQNVNKSENYDIKHLNQKDNSSVKVNAPIM